MAKFTFNKAVNSKATIRISGHCKSVYIVDKDKVCVSLIEAAEVIGCAPSTLSYALANKKLCKGHRVCWLSEIDKYYQARLVQEVELKEATNAYEQYKADCDALYKQYTEAKTLVAQAEKKMKSLMR